MASNSDGEMELASSKPAATLKGEMAEDGLVSSLSTADRNSMSSVSAGDGWDWKTRRKENLGQGEQR